MRDIFPSLVKNDKIRHALSGNLSHAYIIEGAVGTGRMTAVKNAAAAALCENRGDENFPLPCGRCSVCDRIFRGIHPDVAEYSTGSKKSIGVDTAREIRSQVFISPTESEYKFFIIRDADLMTPEAQNALLISLEEPAPFSVFFLLVSDKSLLLETIRSRCITLSTESLDEESLTMALKETPEGERLSVSDPDALREIVSDSSGSLGAALAALRGDGSDNGDSRAAGELVRVILSGSPSEKAYLSVGFTKSRESAMAIFTITISAVRDIIACKTKSDSPLLYYSDTEDIRSYMSIPLVRLMNLYLSLESGIEELRGNASVSLTAERIIMQKL